MSRRIATIQKWWKAEASRRFLWLPVCFGVGVGIYLGLPDEPPLSLFSVLLVMWGIAAVWLWRAVPVMIVAVMLILGGAAWSAVYTQWTTDPVLHEALEPRAVAGIVNDIVRTEHGVRLTLDHVRIEDVEAADTPSQVRLSVRLRKDDPLTLPTIGDEIQIRAGLRPPMGPALPHGFDFARYFYFRGIGGVGYGLPPWVVVTPNAQPGIADLFMTWRVGVTEDIIATLGTGVGGIAAGLVTGDARAISRQDFDDLRASNLYHIIAISGEHMVVIAGVIFVTLRTLALALPRRIALRPQVKTVSAVITLALVTVYLFVTGLPISAVRAYVMITLVLLGVIFRRQGNPMRSLAITGFIMLVFNPANLLDPGFQLSFAATLAIIALVESAILKPALAVEEPRGMKVARVFATMILISVVAEIATLPFVISQFNNVSPYGVIANMLATPVMSFYLMPTVALFFILLPFGLQHGALWLMKWGILALLGIGRWVAHFPHAQLFLPALPGYGVALFALGLMWVCLWQTRGRLFGVIAMVLGVATMSFNHLPDMLIGSGLKQIVLRTDEGYVLARGRATSMIPSLWANGLGYHDLPEADRPAWRCDPLGCVARVKGAVVAFPVDAAALAEDCHAANLVFTIFSRVQCDGARVFDQDMLQDRNVTALWITPGGVRIETSDDWQGKRPWSAVDVSEE